MKAQFKKWLIVKGYSNMTPSGKPSTVDDYANRIEKVCKWESMTWTALANDIEKIIQEYSVGGIKAEKGKESHASVINALRRFKEFISDC